MQTTRLKLLSAGALVLGLLTAGALYLAGPAWGDDPGGKPAARAGSPAAPQATPGDKPAPPGGPKRPPQRSCILLWMSGGPSQFETFDLKPANGNGGPFQPIDTTVKGVEQPHVGLFG